MPEAALAAIHASHRIVLISFAEMPASRLCCRGCCGRAKVSPNGKPDEVDVAAKPRKCTDCCCCLLLLVFWLGMGAVLVLGLRNGEPERSATSCNERPG